MPLSAFHPAVAAWFESQFAAPTEPQVRAWPAIREGRHVLIAAPTGSGKTLAAFLAAIDDLVRLAEAGTLRDETHVLYISPLKALSNDIQKNLQGPLAGIGAELAIRGLPDAAIRTLVRTGDTPAKEREAMVRRPPHIVVTTPESFYILLTSERGRNLLRTVRTVIVDEIHAVVGSKRGSHLALSLARLEALTGEKLTRIGLSATQRPIEDVARFLVGSSEAGATEHGNGDGAIPCTVIDTGHRRTLDLALEIPESPLEVVMSGEVWEEIYDRLALLIAEHRSTLVFVNTRRLTERVARHLTERLGAEHVTSHHGSLSREQRLAAESRLKAGTLKALVATSSLELGIDIGDVDLVCQVGSTRSIAAFLQRVGRSGHAVAGTPRGRLFPTSRDDLVEAAALLDAVRRGELDRLHIPTGPLDILAQQIVAAVAADEWDEDRLFQLVRRAYPYRDLTRGDFDAVVAMLSEGFATRRGRRSTYLHRDAVNRRLRGRRGARLAAITSGGAIPDTADYRVIEQPTEHPVGTVNEDFAVESMSGDIFQLGNTSWRILRVEPGTVRVEDAAGQPPTIPFWLGEAPGRTEELSHSVSRLRAELDERFVAAESVDGALADGVRWLSEERNLPLPAARQIAEYLLAGRNALGVMPTRDTLVLERFFDESGGMQLVVHSPQGSRLNRAWGLSLRKRFCRSFNFELQAAADENAIVLSLGPSHSFPLEDVFRFLSSATVRDLLVQALLDAPIWNVRWRWNVTRALAVLRMRGGKKNPPQLQRMQADDLLAAVFPDQAACLENVVGDREIPDHPLVRETIRDCLTEAMDIEALENLLRAIEGGRKTLVARDLAEPSPFAQEILNARPYTYLDDAPLEERRTQAVMSRRWLDPRTASDLGALDVAAIETVREEARPQVENADELHDALVLLGFLTQEEGAPWTNFRGELERDRRAAVLRVPGRDEPIWVAAERLHHWHAVHGDLDLTPRITSPFASTVAREEALRELVRSRLEGLGPVTLDALARPFGVPASEIEQALLGLESEGFVLRGRFTPGMVESEWCERRLLARIHRATLSRLRREIEPVTAADFLRFLFRWQRVLPGERGEGSESLLRVLEQLEGWEAAAVAWEGDILPARVASYQPAWLDSLCHAGRVAWARLSAPQSVEMKGAGPVRSTPVALVPRRNLGLWLGLAAATGPRNEPALSSGARVTLEALRGRGACFFEEIVQETRLLRTQVEEALAELAAWGLVTADGFTGLRALLVPTTRRKPVGGRTRRSPTASFGIEDAGRWSVLPRGEALLSGETSAAAGATTGEEATEAVARLLLRRYGVVMKRIVEREGPLPPWRDLLRVYRRLEAAGEIRGGRFVAGFSGEQYALPEAVGTLRDVRRKSPEGEMVSVGGCDPLNLIGILTPGSRVPALVGNRVLYRDGVPLAVRVGGTITFVDTIEPGMEWEARKALARHPVPPVLRQYLGSLG